MLAIKILLLSSICYMAYSSESSEELEDLLSSQAGAFFMKTLVKDTYDKDKLNIICSLTESAQGIFSNATLIGAQNIYGPNGEVVQIRTVELHMPRNIATNIKKQDEINHDDDDEDDDEDTLLSEVTKIFSLVSKLGFAMEVTGEEYDKLGNLETKSYIDKDLWYSYGEKAYLVNKTIEVDTINVVNEKIQELQEKNLSVAIHKYDAKSLFLSEKSNVIPEYTVSVISEEGDVNQKFLDEASKGLALVFLKYQHNQVEVPSKLAEYLGLKYPKIDFIVFLNEPKAWYVAKDFKIILRYDISDWDSSTEIIYTIFGLKK